MKRLIAYFLIFSTAIVLSSAPSFALPNVVKPQKIQITVNPNINIEVKGESRIFKDAGNKVLYPINYNGSTYLPVRSISELMGKPIEWDSASKTVFIGKTLSNPGKSKLDESYKISTQTSSDAISNSQKSIYLGSAYLKPDVLVMYDFVLQNFSDENGDAVYPLIYEGYTYLPVRAASVLMGQTIAWDSSAKKISIGKAELSGNEVTEKETVEKSKEALQIEKYFENSEALYYEATSKATLISKAATAEEKASLSADIHDNYIKAQAIKEELAKSDLSLYSEEQKAVIQKIQDFAESNEYYVLLLENIACLSAQGDDYSMLADTFLYFAMDAQTKMEDARKSLLELK